MNNNNNNSSNANNHRLYHHVPYGEASFPEFWTTAVTSYDKPTNATQNCPVCGESQFTFPCFCGGAYFCSDDHRARSCALGHLRHCGNAAQASAQVDQVIPILDMIKQTGVDPYKAPLAPYPNEPLLDPPAKLHHDSLDERFMALRQMYTGTAIRQALQILQTLNGLPFQDFNDMQDNAFDSYETQCTPVLLNRIGEEWASWSQTIDWARSDADARRQRISGVAWASIANPTPDIDEPISHIFQPQWLPWNEHDILCLLNHLLLKLKALLALKDVQNARLIAYRMLRHANGHNVFLTPDIVQQIQLECATPLLLASASFRRLILNGQDLQGLAQILRCHVRELATHIERQNEAFWPFFVNPDCLILDPTFSDYPIFSYPWTALTSMRLYFAAFAETPGALEWIKTEMEPTQVHVGVMQAKFLARGWGTYPPSTVPR